MEFYQSFLQAKQYNGKFSVKHYYELDVSKDTKRLQIIGLENIRKLCNIDDLEQNQYEIYYDVFHGFLDPY